MEKEEVIVVMLGVDALSNILMEHRVTIQDVGTKI